MKERRHDRQKYKGGYISADVIHYIMLHIANSGFSYIIRCHWIKLKDWIQDFWLDWHGAISWIFMLITWIPILLLVVYIVFEILLKGEK